MFDFHSVMQKGILYRWIEGLFFSHPSVHWICVGIVTALLCLLLFIDHKWLERFPLYGYMTAVLGLLVLLDLLTQTIPILTVYLIVLGYVLFRSTDEKPHIITACFTLSYVLISVFTAWSQFILIELASHCLLFIWVAWMSGQVRSAFFELQKQKEKIRYLIDQKNESNKRLRDFQKELEETYLRDSLTGLYNFHGFQEQVIRSLSRCWHNQSYHVVCMDLTDFRQVNMKEGIDVGDRILVQIAHLFKKHLPPTARLARYDGDQFAIGLMGDEVVLRRVLETIESIMSEVRLGRNFLNYCIGTATYPQEAQSGGELIRLAEERLTIEQRRIRDKEEEQRRHLEKLSALGQLAAGLAHEIRNPLTSIRGFVQISAAESEAVKKWESIILPEIDRINDLLKQFLKLSEVKPVQVTRFNLDQLMSDVISLLEPKSLLMGHELKQHPPAESVVIEADAEQLKQVLINLIQNGLEALSVKGTVEVKWTEVHDYVHIAVKDNGGGIKPEHFNRIFDPFFTTKGDGTGMGLSICHRIITEHGGQIFVESQPGRGTTFNIYLPLRQKRTEAVYPAVGKEKAIAAGVAAKSEVPKGRELQPVKPSVAVATGSSAKEILITSGAQSNREEEETKRERGQTEIGSESQASVLQEEKRATLLHDEGEEASVNTGTEGKGKRKESKETKGESQDENGETGRNRIKREVMKKSTPAAKKEESKPDTVSDLERAWLDMGMQPNRDKKSIEEKVEEIIKKAEKAVEAKLKKAFLKGEAGENTGNEVEDHPVLEDEQKVHSLKPRKNQKNAERIADAKEKSFRVETAFAPKVQRAVK